jgi:hypothetical protein
MARPVRNPADLEPAPTHTHPLSARSTGASAPGFLLKKGQKRRDGRRLAHFISNRKRKTMTPQTVSLSSLEPGWVTRARQWIAMATASRGVARQPALRSPTPVAAASRRWARPTAGRSARRLPCRRIPYSCDLNRRPRSPLTQPWLGAPSMSSSPYPRHERAARIKEREGKRISRRSGRSVRATKPGSHWTRRWREMDSNFRFPNRFTPVFESGRAQSGCTRKSGSAADSALEGDGFELPVPREKKSRNLSIPLEFN